MKNCKITAACFGCVCILTAFGPSAAAQTIYPSADGTLVDGDGFGAFDGLADAADWSFNQSSYEGAITLLRGATTGVEQRVVWEFNLAAVTAQPPVTARLTFTLRGAARIPAELAPVQVVTYPSDLLENFGDFSAGPATLLAEESVEPFQSPTTYVINISEEVNEALLGGIRRIALRFQISPQADADSNQAFMDALDSDPHTKPFITIVSRIPGDYDNDQDVDLDDFDDFPGCMLGPDVAVSPPCRFLDDDLDTDVDLIDLGAFLDHFTRWGN